MLSADGVLDGEQRDRSQWHRGDNPGGPQGSRIGGPLRGISAMAFALRRWMLHTLHGHRHPGKFIHHRRSFPHQKGQRSSDTSFPRLRRLSFKFSTSIAISLLFVSSLLFHFLTRPRNSKSLYFIAFEWHAFLSSTNASRLFSLLLFRVASLFLRTRWNIRSFRSTRVRLSSATTRFHRGILSLCRSLSANTSFVGFSEIGNFLRYDPTTRWQKRWHVF